MRKKLFCLLFLSGLCCMASATEERDALVIRLADQTHVQFILPDQQPSLVCQNDTMKVWFLTEENAEWKSLQFTPDDVAEMTFEKVNTTQIDEVLPTEKRIRFDLSRGSLLRVTGLKQGDRLQVVALDGKSILAPVNRQNNEATIDFSSQPRGCYVVSINRSFTFKLLKP